MDFWHRSARTSRREMLEMKQLDKKWILKIQLFMIFGQSNYFSMNMSEEWMKKITSNIVKLDTYWKKKKRETKNKMERRNT
jgi:hypothetical protein